MTDLVRIVIGPMAWLAAFSGVYGLHGVACAFGWAEIGIWGFSMLRVALTAAWLVSIALLGAILAGLYRGRFAAAQDFVGGVSRMTGWVGLIATLWSLFPVVAMSSCQ